MSLNSFVSKMKKTGDGAYLLEFRQRLEMTDSFIAHRKNDALLKRFIVMELNTIRDRFSRDIDKMIREVLDEE